jgi:hypothetical protein
MPQLEESGGQRDEIIRLAEMLKASACLTW